MVEHARQAGVPFRWFSADEEFGQNPGLRDYLHNAHIAYVMAVPKTTEFTDAGGRRITVKDLPSRLRKSGIGTKGYRIYDWAVIDSGDPDHQYMIRRSIDDGELAFYHYYNPRHEPAGELVPDAGTRWPIEECFETTKGHTGLDNYQVHLYHAWYRHITLAMLAHTFLAILAHRHRAKKRIHTQSPCRHRREHHQCHPGRTNQAAPVTNPPDPRRPMAARYERIYTQVIAEHARLVVAPRGRRRPIA